MDNPLKKLFNSATSVFSRSGAGGSALGIDIGTSAIKIVEIKKKGSKAVLETYGSISLGPYAGTEVGRVTNLPLEKIVEALKEVLKQSNVSTTDSALSVSVQSSLVFTMDLPAKVDESQIASIIPNEARKFIPVPITEVSLDYFILPKKEPSYEEMNAGDSMVAPQDKKEVLVVAIQNDAIEKLRTVVKDTMINSSFFELEIFSSVRANFEHELSLVLLIDFGASRTKLSLVEFGIVKNYHTINRGGADITDAVAKSLDIPFEKAENLKKEFGLYENTTENKMAEVIKSQLDYIFSETNNVLLGYEKKYGRTVSKVIFTGGGALMKGLKEISLNNFRADVEIGRPFKKVGAPQFLEKVLESTGPEFAVAIGLALRKLQ